MRSFAAILALAAVCGVERAVGKRDHCGGCRTLTDNFKREYGNTAGKHSGAGNAAWEAARGIKYSTSETRLFEIMENVCGKSDRNCLDFLEEHEETVEQWWLDNAVEGQDVNKLWQYLCVDTAKVCCAAGHFGKACKQCPGGSKAPCSDHGSCDGAGTRGGKGKCKCYSGYSGKKCSKCKKGYFLQGGADSNKMTCETCDAACSGGCTGPGDAFCKECAAGYAKDGDGKCGDVDECAAGSAECAAGKFCVNTPGNYTCNACDTSCHPDDGCAAAGPRGCAEKSCADGYKHSDEAGCTDVDECLDEGYCKEVGKYCFNKAGGAACLPCATACDKPLGCVNGTTEGCHGCAEGYQHADGQAMGCVDIDECNEDPVACGENFACRNTRGSFECNCVEPNIKDGDVCKKVEQPPAADAAADAAAGAKDEL